jgi:two-component system alkaline phosphatase synthesis response regulator PhoP
LSSVEECNFIRKVLKHQEYLILEALSAEIALQKVVENAPDLIICQNNLNETSGFQVYRHLKPFLIKNYTPFFIYSDEFDQEDILIGLEMGIDNFIISPVDKDALVHKIEHHIKKIKELKQNETERFIAHFDATPVAKFVMKNKRIELANKAFRRLMHLSPETDTFPSFDEIFNISGNKKNLIDFRKCIHGFVQQCSLENVPCLLKDGNCFDVHLCYDDSDTEKLFAEVFPSFVDDKPESLATKPDGYENSWKKRNIGKESVTIKLTTREKQILHLSSLGLPIKQIAAQLEVSQRTIEKHRANIMQKTDSNSIIEAIHILNQNNGYKMLNVV